MRAPRLIALVLALQAGRAGAQAEPPATWDPRGAKAPEAQPPAEPPPSTPTPTPTATPTSTPTPTPTATPTPTPTPTSTPTPTPTPTAASDAESAPLEPLRIPAAGAYRWHFMASAGPAAKTAPSLLVGVGVALGTVHETRLEVNALLGWSPLSEEVPVQPSWNDGVRTYGSASKSARAFLFELAGSRRAGGIELRAGGGVHVSIPQFEATYEATRCTDLLCLGPKYRETDTDEQIGSGATGLLLTAGTRLPIVPRVLLGVDLRWLAPATSRVKDYGVSIRTGGVAASIGFTVGLGAPVAR